MGYATQHRSHATPAWRPARTMTGEFRSPPARRRPSTTPAREPTSNRDRRRMVKATLFRLASLVGHGTASLKAMPTDQIYDLVANLRDRQGDARRELAKLIRLEPGRPATAGR